MHITDRSLQDLAAQVGAGDHGAFRRLYTACAPTALTVVRGHIPERGQSMHVVRATFCEVWRMCAFDVRCGTRTQAVPAWITAIAHRRGAERHRALRLIREASPRSQAAFWRAMLATTDQCARLELATMLDGPDHAGLRPEPAQG